MPTKKQYIITSITLGIIAASSAALIGLTNFLTRDQIARNEKNRINAGIHEIFGDDSKASEEEKFEKEYNYLTGYYKVSDNEDKSLGFAIKSSGSNMYGKISLIIGFSEDTHAFLGLYTVVNEQTYASTLEENYLIPVNENEREYTDVKCGATYGAKLVRDMILEASDAVKDLGK